MPLLSCRILGERFELDIILAQQILVLTETFQQLSLRKLASPSARGQRRWYTLRAGLDAICAGKLTITFHLALLTEHTRQHPLWPRSLGRWGKRGRRHVWGTYTALWRSEHRRHGWRTSGVPPGSGRYPLMQDILNPGSSTVKRRSLAWARRRPGSWTQVCRLGLLKSVSSERSTLVTCTWVLTQKRS
jgi:hypothetical protein